MIKFSSLAAALAIGLSGIAACAPATFAETAAAQVTISNELPSGDFIRKKKRLKGAWEVVQRGDKQNRRDRFNQYRRTQSHQRNARV